MPTLFTGTAACTVGLWLYLNESNVEVSARHTQRPARVANPVDRHADPTTGFLSTPFIESTTAVVSTKIAIANARTPSTPDASVRTKTLARIEAFLLNRRDVLAALGEQFDREAVRWRNNLSREPFVATLVAWMFYHAGDTNAADRAFAHALSVRPTYAAAQSGRAHIHMLNGDVNRAIDAFRQICTANPSDVAARYNLGVLLTRIMRFGEATAEYRRVLAIDPNHTRSLYNAASLAQRDGRLAEARDLWERFVRIEPNVISVWFNLGVVHMDFDDPFAAAHCFSAAASIDPDELINRLNLAMALIDAGQIETAHDILEQAVLDHPCNPALLDILADAKRRIADWYPQQRYAILADSRALEETVAEINADHQLAESRLAGDAMSGDAAGMIGP